ncbi:MAG: hypothetical protein ACXWKO_04740 [Phenylobacterium sp.]
MARSRRRYAAVVFAALSLAVSACATQTGPRRVEAESPESARVAKSQSRSDAMVSGDSEGLGITGPKTPAALLAIVAAPYALPSPPECAALAREIADLDALLGPDVDNPKSGAKPEDRAASAVGSAVRGAIPYRWVLRWLTGAGDRDKQLRQAILAGAARRGFLKGVSRARGCPTSLATS